MNVGFVGLGVMGTPMVVNLLKHGFRVKVYTAHLDSQNVKRAVRAGAVVATSSRALAQDSEIVILSLPRAEVSESVSLGEGGVLQGASRGTIIVEMSTVPPSTVQKIGRDAKLRGVEVLDAPVSGGRIGAEQGTLTIIVGGKKEAFGKCLPVFQALGKNIYHVGELGAGETIKLINTVLADGNLLIAREGLELALESNIDLKLLQRIVATSTGQSWMWNNWVPDILDGKVVGASFDIVLKDFGYALAMAAEAGVEPKLTKEVSAVVAAWRQAKGGSSDLSSAFGFQQSGTRAKK